MNNKKSNNSNQLFGLLFLVSFFYSLFSYSLTDPNLVLTSWAPYWNFQQWMWQTFFHNSNLLTSSFLLLVVGYFLVYFLGLKNLKTEININPTKFFIKILFALSPLFFSYNALSHDVFNYIFNAKMAVVYQADPHQQVALDFPQDNWLRFMHNTHTPAPYGYGWTIFSILPYLVGFNKFLPTWFIFKALAWLSYILLFLVLKLLIYKVSNRKITAADVWLVFANPLVIIEILSNLHNDFWMLIPAIISMVLVIKKPKRIPITVSVISLFFLGFSISTKFVTILLLPLWLYWFIGWFFENPLRNDLLKKVVEKNLFLFISLILFIPLFTLRSQQFLPWYLTWSIIWLPLISYLPWKKLVLAFSLSGLLRYLPWLLAGGFANNVISQQKYITWLGGVIFFGLLIISEKFKKNKLN
ncbi:MAG: hypothetical protein AUK08_01445 [Candidatus Pacebacteria bacterium CG2_30_36_39]|nr:MAG: hypothetical protein AUK08_01445 [Candidatus Pacebacteria bacterium CG2_30_36_39]